MEEKDPLEDPGWEGRDSPAEGGLAGDVGSDPPDNWPSEPVPDEGD